MNRLWFETNAVWNIRRPSPKWVAIPIPTPIPFRFPSSFRICTCWRRPHRLISHLQSGLSKTKIFDSIRDRKLWPSNLRPFVTRWRSIPVDVEILAAKCCTLCKTSCSQWVACVPQIQSFSKLFWLFWRPRVG